MFSYRLDKADARPVSHCAFAKVALFALYAVTAATLVILWSVVPTSPAFAYVDPSVMTYTIQAVAGVAVALSAVAGVFFRRSRKALFRLLKIDENANKETDQTWRRINNAEAQELDEETKQARAQ